MLQINIKYNKYNFFKYILLELYFFNVICSIILFQIDALNPSIDICYSCSDFEPCRH